MPRLATIVLVVILAGTASGQEAGTLPPGVQVGARVRASTPRAATVTGRLVAASADTLRVLRDRAADTVSVAVSRLTSLDLSTGQHKRRLAGAAIGFFGGAALGAVVGAVTYRKQACAPGTWFCDYPGRAGDMVAGAVLFGGAGTIVGAIVGAGRADTWQRVIPRETTQVGLVVPGAAGRLAVGASLRF